jgi:hypothetical protein
MDFNYRIRLAALVIAAGLAFTSAGGCAQKPLDSRKQAVAAPSPSPKLLAAADLAKLRWIEGSWRGTGDGQSPFYERYRFEDDTILVVESFDDEKLTRWKDVNRYELKDGQFSNVGNTRWVATDFNDYSITFSPVAVAKNSFTWQRESADLWRAVLKWPATEENPARERVYKMERLTAVVPKNGTTTNSAP